MQSANAEPTSPRAGNGGTDQPNSDLFATPNQPNDENDWTRFDLPPSPLCPFAGFRPGNDDGPAEDWVDCVLNSTWRDSADPENPLLDK